MDSIHSPLHFKINSTCRESRSKPKMRSQGDQRLRNRRKSPKAHLRIPSQPSPMRSLFWQTIKQAFSIIKLKTLNLCSQRKAIYQSILRQRLPDLHPSKANKLPLLTSSVSTLLTWMLVKNHFLSRSLLSRLQHIPQLTHLSLPVKSSIRITQTIPISRSLTLRVVTHLENSSGGSQQERA